ncbi:MAG: V-type ATP synthase subunit F [Spirochaetota bacterium]
MEAVYLIGDVHTVNAFRISGIKGFIADAKSSGSILEYLLRQDNASVIIITRECAETLAGEIKRINLESPQRVIIEIPGIDDERGFGKSLTSYITEALGVAL